MDVLCIIIINLYIISMLIIRLFLPLKCALISDIRVMSNYYHFKLKSMTTQNNNLIIIVDHIALGPAK